MRLLALPLAVVAFQAYDSSVRPLPESLEKTLIAQGRWKPGCPVPLSDLRLLTVKHWDFDGKSRTGQLVVNGTHAKPLASVFRTLYELRFPIRHMRLDDMYGPARARPGRR